MSRAPTPQEIVADATWLAQALDGAAGLVRLVRMSPEAYRDAAFLDDRLMARPVEKHVMQWSDVASALPSAARRDARWIFHIGHVGSTLIARLLGELDLLLSVREPRLLRDLVPIAPADRREMAAISTTLYSRCFANNQVAVVKATSFVSEIAPELIGPKAPALFLYAGPRAYMEGILAGENSVQELRALAATRTERMRHRIPDTQPPETLAGLAALAWACEMTALESAAETIGEAVIHWSDFDRILSDIGGSMITLANALQLPATPEEAGKLDGSPLLRRYSKATEYEYSPQLRRDLLAEARARHGLDIDKAMHLLHKIARSAPLLERALERAAPEN